MASQKLTPKQEAAILALLTEPTYEAAAEKAKITTRQLRRWLALPVFQAAYRRARRQLLDSALTKLQQCSGAAVDCLYEVVEGINAEGFRERTSDRIRAALGILEYSTKTLESHDLLDRIEELEQAILDLQHNESDTPKTHDGSAGPGEDADPGPEQPDAQAE